MDLLHRFLDLFLNLDAHLGHLVDRYGFGVYLLLFLIVYCETGLVVTPILPGDSMLFAAGALAALPNSPLRPELLIPLLICAALLGDNTNYFIGRALGPRVFTRPKSWFFNPDYLHYTSKFYDRHGGKAVVIARFAPILRTFAPFVAGIGRMRYGRFLSFCVFGAAMWVSAFVMAGYEFGQNAIVKKNFHLVILAIIVISLLPAAYGFFKARMAAKSAGASGEDI
ncbi:MAG TPA: DedA family protein [Opitutales bacterium]|jgi:membrane-associated protein|nr:DedA family protein [Opitutales bacterium]